MTLAANITNAQGPVDMAAYVDDTTIGQIGESNAASLKNKVSKIITRNGMADAEGLFAVVPTLTITDEGTVDTGMASLRVVYADFTLSVKNIVENTVFASQTIKLQANGNSEQACIRSLINKINVNDVRFAKMIKDVQGSIADYYSRQMPKIMATVESCIAREQYEEAMVALAAIPECVEEYQKALDLKVKVYNKLMENKVTSVLAEADILARQGKVDEAFELCRKCSPLSPNYGKVTDFLNALDAKKAAAEAEARLKEMDADGKDKQQKIMEEASEEGRILKETYAVEYKKKGKSLGAVLFGL